MPDPVEKPESPPVEWLSHRWTLRLHKYLEQQHAQAINALFAACQKSSDPKVTAAYAGVQMFGDFANLVKLENGSEEDDGDDTGNDGDG